MVSAYCKLPDPRRLTLPDSNRADSRIMPSTSSFSSAPNVRVFRYRARLGRALRAWAMVLGLPAVVLGIAPATVRAHAIVVAAQPAVNSTVARGDVAIRLEFNSRIDRQRSRVSARRPDGTEIAVALASDDPPNVVSGHVDATLTGPWKLHWQVLSLDGHITRGDVSFSVAEDRSAR